MGARVSEMSEEEALEYELYPKGSSAWLHDYRLRATGKMWKNVVLTQYMLVPPTVRLCASVFVCDPLTPSGAPDPAMSVHLSRADYTYMCDTTEYMLVRWVGWLGAFFYAFVVPMFWVISLYRRRNLLSSFSNFQQFGFLYVCYKRDSWIAYQWDVVETWRKLALGTLIIFVTPGSMTQLGCFFVVCLMALVIHMQVMPFESEMDNNLQTNCLLAIVLTVFYAIFQKMKALTDAVEREGSGGRGTGLDNMSALDTVVIGLHVVVLVSTLGTFALLTNKLRILVPKICKALRKPTQVGAPPENDDSSDDSDSAPADSSRQPELNEI